MTAATAGHVKRVSGNLAFWQLHGFFLITSEGDFYVPESEVPNVDWGEWQAGHVEFTAEAKVELVHPCKRADELTDEEWEESPIAHRVDGDYRPDGIVVMDSMVVQVHYINFTAAPTPLPQPVTPGTSSSTAKARKSPKPQQRRTGKSKAKPQAPKAKSKSSSRSPKRDQVIEYLGTKLKSKQQVDALVELLEEYRHGCYSQQKLVAAMRNIAKHQAGKATHHNTELIAILALLLFGVMFTLHQYSGSRSLSPTPSPIATSASTPLATPGTNAQKLATIAQAWAGREFEARQTAMCARFVRHVIQEAGLKDPGVTSKPWDGMLPTSADLANSFAGDDLGQRITDISQVKAGDIVFWKNTYGRYAANTITHVGIAVDDQGTVVDRSTANEPVKQRKISDIPTEDGGDAFAGAIRINWGS